MSKIYYISLVLLACSFAGLIILSDTWTKKIGVSQTTGLSSFGVLYAVLAIFIFWKARA